MTRCVHEFEKNSEGEVVCVLCGDKDDEMESIPPVETQPPPDFWATQSSFE